MEIFIVGALIIFVLIYNKTIDTKKFVEDNQKYANKLMEEDYEFLLHAKYGDNVNVEELFKKRFMYAFLVAILFLFIFLSDLSLINVVLTFVVGVVMFKLPYFQLQRYYKQHLHEIDLMLPYYLKGLEILIQHYTVPVAIGRSIADAPDIFKPGLREMIEKINAGDSSIQPYMDFANEYPVRDSMRMMRLLYRLGLGGQEKKQERLLMFSKSVSSLQSKARETKYKERLEHMESLTHIMLIVTGVGVMLVIVMSMMHMF